MVESSLERSSISDHRNLSELRVGLENIQNDVKPILEFWKQPNEAHSYMELRGSL